MSDQQATTPSVSDTASADQARWLTKREKGTALGIGLVVRLATVAGRRPARALLWPIATYYALFHRDVRAASRVWLSQATGRQARLRDTIRHVRYFAAVTLDRLFFLRGQPAGCTFAHFGHEHLVRAATSGKGALLLGAHLGSTSAMGAEGYDEKLRVNIVGYFKNATMINEALYHLNPQGAARVVHVDPSSPSTVLAVRERLDKGELVALAADRVGLNERTVTLPFMGRPATFPLAPFVLAAVLDRPVLLVFALYRDPGHYELHCEPFADTLRGPRRNRTNELKAHVARYAERLESYARSAPFNWFNFYDFWANHDGDSSHAALPRDTPDAAE